MVHLLCILNLCSINVSSNNNNNNNAQYVDCHRITQTAPIFATERHGTPQFEIRHSRSTKFLSVQHDKLWPTSIFVRRPSCLELTARTPATNHFSQTFQVLSKNVFIRADIALSALETFLFSGLYKFTYLLTYCHYTINYMFRSLWGHSSVCLLLNDLSNTTFRISGRATETSFLFQCISVTVQHFNTILLQKFTDH